MELSWSTFIFEIINFLVLVWILKRFLYVPVLAVIANRRKDIEKTLADAAAMRDEAKQLQDQYGRRLADWDQEKQQARDALHQELENERAQRMETLQKALAHEREKSQVAEARRQADQLASIETTAMQHAAQFATQLLQQTAGPELQARLVGLLITELARIPDERLSALRRHFEKATESITITSAFPLDRTQQQQLEHVLSQVYGAPASIQFEHDQTLLAGISVHLGAWVLAANLRDELKAFAELAQPSPISGKPAQDSERNGA